MRSTTVRRHIKAVTITAAAVAGFLAVAAVISSLIERDHLQSAIQIQSELDTEYASYLTERISELDTEPVRQFLTAPVFAEDQWAAFVDRVAERDRESEQFLREDAEATLNGVMFPWNAAIVAEYVDTITLGVDSGTRAHLYAATLLNGVCTDLPDGQYTSAFAGAADTLVPAMIAAAEPLCAVQDPDWTPKR